MKKYLATSLILLTAAVASGFPSPNERFVAALDKIKSIQSALENFGKPLDSPFRELILAVLSHPGW